MWKHVVRTLWVFRQRKSETYENIRNKQEVYKYIYDSNHVLNLKMLTSEWISRAKLIKSKLCDENKLKS